MTIRRMRITRCIPKATDTHSEYVTFHGNNGYTNAPKSYVHKHYIASLGFGLFTESKQPLRLAYHRTEEWYRVCVSNGAWSRNLNNQAV
jgi:hypothetical protein